MKAARAEMAIAVLAYNLKQMIGNAGIECGVLVERDAYAKVAADMSSTEQRLRTEIAALGQGRVKPWRSEEKLATLAGCWRLR